MSKYLSRREAAAYLTEKGLPITVATLAKKATYGGGPPFYRFGNRSRYTPEDLDAWAQERLGEPISSTSEPA